MAIANCQTCGTTTFASVSTDKTGTLAICAAGHYTFDASSASSTTIRTGRVTTTGQSAIGHGATAIGRL